MKKRDICGIILITTGFGIIITLFPIVQEDIVYHYIIDSEVAESVSEPIYLEKGEYFIWAEDVIPGFDTAQGISVYIKDVEDWSFPGNYYQQTIEGIECQLMVRYDLDRSGNYTLETYIDTQAINDSNIHIFIISNVPTYINIIYVGGWLCIFLGAIILIIDTIIFYKKKYKLRE